MSFKNIQISTNGTGHYQYKVLSTFTSFDLIAEKINWAHKNIAILRLNIENQTGSGGNASTGMHSIDKHKPGTNSFLHIDIYQRDGSSIPQRIHRITVGSDDANGMIGSPFNP